MSGQIYQKDTGVTHELSRMSRFEALFSVDYLVVQYVIIPFMQTSKR